MLTDPGHAELHLKPATLVTLAGAFDIEEDLSVVGPRLTGDAAPFAWAPIADEMSLASLLWDVLDDSPGEDPVFLPIERLWQVLTDPASNPLNGEITRTAEDLHTVLAGAGIDPFELAQLFQARDICVDANASLSCDSELEVNGRSAWNAIDSDGTGTVFGYPYPAAPPPAGRPEAPLVKAWALQIAPQDTHGLPLDGVRVAARISYGSAVTFGYGIVLEGAPSEMGFYLPEDSTAVLTFEKDGYLPAQLAITSDEYLAGVLDPAPYALSLAPVLTQLGSHAPTAAPVSGSFSVNTTVTVVLTGSDPDGDPLIFAVASTPAHGSLGAVTSSGPASRRSGC